MASSYLEGYGIEDEKRSRAIRYIIFGVLAALILVVVGYFVFRDYSEKQVAKKFLNELNEHNYQAAYATWCPTHCDNYDYSRFAADWANKKIGSAWKIDSTDSCKAFLTVNVTADGSDIQSLSVERGTKVLSFAPAPDCQEYKWHWKQFFKRVFGSG
jgi:Tfp pilus assembly protein PilN